MRCLDVLEARPRQTVTQENVAWLRRKCARTSRMQAGEDSGTTRADECAFEKDTDLSCRDDVLQDDEEMAEEEDALAVVIIVDYEHNAHT
mgnify:CR=1 FL=1